jgi:predicted DNA-binding WGR domain protein
MNYLLQRINLDLNQARYYRVEIGPCVTSLYAVHRIWGRIGCRRSGARIMPCTDLAEAQRLAERWVQAKVRRGYVVVEPEEMAAP